MTTLEFNAIWTKIEIKTRAERDAHPELRYGQALFWAANEFFPDQLKQITGDLGEGGRDCFYNDRNIPNFWRYLFNALVNET